MNGFGNQQPMMGSPSSVFNFSSLLGNGGPRQVNPQAVEQQLVYGGLEPNTAAITADLAADMVKIKNILPLSVQGLTSQEISELAIAAAKSSEESDSRRMGSSGMGPRGMGSIRMGSSGMGSSGMGSSGMGSIRMGSSGMGSPYYNGGKKRRTRRRKQRGGCNGYSSNSLAFNAAPFTGGRRSRRRKSHKKRGKRSHRR